MYDNRTIEIKDGVYCTRIKPGPMIDMITFQFGPIEKGLPIYTVFLSRSILNYIKYYSIRNEKASKEEWKKEMKMYFLEKSRLKKIGMI